VNAITAHHPKGNALCIGEEKGFIIEDPGGPVGPRLGQTPLPRVRLGRTKSRVIEQASQARTCQISRPLRTALLRGKTYPCNLRRSSFRGLHEQEGHIRAKGKVRA
jgi:hypothetical protein